MEQKVITYEQPLNEHSRICLRLEYLFKQAEYYLDKSSVWDTHNALVTIIEIFNVIDRPDLKSKLVNTLCLHSAALIQLEKSPEVDNTKLRKILHQLDQFIDTLHHTQGKLGQNLRDNEFLMAIRQRLNIAGGTCNFTIPGYHLWLQQPIEQKHKNLRAWFNTFSQLQAIVNLLLQITRNSTQPQPKTAPEGFYQEALATEIPYQMIRVVIPIEHNISPDISVGRHRLSIHFFNCDVTGRAAQVTDDVNFKLACCKI